MVLRVTDRQGETREIRPTALGPRHHEVVLPPLDTIEPRVEISVRRDGKELFHQEEWLPALATVEQAGAEEPEAEPDRAMLQQIAEITGGAVDADLSTILRRAPAERQIVSPLGGWFAMAALGVLILDLGLRLVRSSLLG